jgi:hypothetical protein
MREVFEVGKRKRERASPPVEGEEEARKSIMVTPEFADMVGDLARADGLSAENWFKKIGFWTYVLDAHATLQEKKLARSRDKLTKMQKGTPPLELN